MVRRVGFIGLGNMGAPMAANLARAGFEVLVGDRRAEPVAELVAIGATAADIPQMAAQVDVLCTCVLYEHQVRELFLGDGAILEHARPGLVAAIHSTVPPGLVKEIEAAARAREVHLIDAPVSGASTASRDGTLTIIAGATETALRIAAPVFEVVASHTIHVGRPGTAQVAKLGNNIMALGNQLLAMEAVQFVEALGLSRDELFRVAAASTGASWAATNFEHFDRYGIEHTLAGTPELPHRLGKDLRHAVEVAQQNWTYLPIVALCSQLLPAMFTTRWAETRQGIQQDR
jgi:3-hydroxyisobutyrate dehydrogenase-like beta-hydroxyacid dehydrogenase